MPELIARLIGKHREHRMLEQAEGDMVRRIRSTNRWNSARRVIREGGTVEGKFPDVTEVDEMETLVDYPRLFAGKKILEDFKKDSEKEMLALVKRLPVTKWQDGIRGFGLKSLAAIIGETGDLSRYPNFRMVWKRLGLHVVDGRAARKVAGSLLEAQKQSYNPRRRSEVFNACEPMLKLNPEFQQTYRARKEVEVQKAQAAGLTVLPAAKIAREKEKDKFISEAHIHKRAMRYAQKQFIKKLWQAWRDAGDEMLPA